MGIMSAEPLAQVAVFSWCGVIPMTVPFFTTSLQDNVNQFIAACKNGFGMKGGQIFEATDLEDPAHRRVSQADMQHHPERDRKIRNVRETADMQEKMGWRGRSQRYAAVSAFITGTLAHKFAVLFCF